MPLTLLPAPRIQKAIYTSLIKGVQNVFIFSSNFRKAKTWSQIAFFFGTPTNIQCVKRSRFF
jgi:hypothetical protein